MASPSSQARRKNMTARALACIACSPLTLPSLAAFIAVPSRAHSDSCQLSPMSVLHTRVHSHAHMGTRTRTCRHSSLPWGVGSSLAPHVSLDLTSNAHVQRPPSTLSPNARTREAGMRTLPAWLSICACAMQLRACPCLHTSIQPIIAQQATCSQARTLPCVQPYSRH